ncbi:MAG: NFACT family protein [Treponema sp.]|nr:NFACT family protein [Treponema sp.]
MSLNCNEINLILKELELEGSFIQKVVQPSYDMLAFRVIKNGALATILICTGSQVCRIHSTKMSVPKNKKPLRFFEFLKSNVQGMRINSCEQMGLDRIIKMDVSTWQQKYYIYIRLWSGAANVIVTDENNVILDCMYRRPKKNEMTGSTFNPEAKVPTQDEINQSLERFPIRDFSDRGEEFEALSFNEKIDRFYSENATSLSREALLAQAEKWYNVKHSKMESALQKLLDKKKSFEHADKLKHTGDLILSYASEYNGGPDLTCTDYESGETVHIRMDEKKSAQENASVYYEQYKKAVSGMESLEHDIQLSQRNLQALEQEYSAISKEQNVIKIEQMLRHDTTPKQKNEKPHPGLHYEVDGWTIIVGRTASENDDLLRHFVKSQDMWLHTRDFAGGYVFIKARKDKTVPLEILLYAGNLAVYHSKARKNGQADLYYTQVKYLRRAKNGPKGLVLPTQEKNIFIKLDEAKLRRLDELEKSRQGI